MSLITVVSVSVASLAVGFVAGRRFGRRARSPRTGFRARGPDRPIVR